MLEFKPQFLVQDMSLILAQVEHGGIAVGLVYQIFYLGFGFPQELVDELFMWSCSSLTEH